MNIHRPPFQSIPLAAGLKWSGGGFRYEEKLDGVWAVKELHGGLLAGEQMRDGRFFAFDIVNYNGQDLRGLALRERLNVLDNELAGKVLRP